MIDDQRRLIFVENPKTATNSVKAALMGKENIFNPYDPRIGTQGHHIPAILQRRYPTQWQDYTSLVVVRNTWDRAYSFFNFYTKVAGAESYEAMGFEQWVEKGCPPPKEGQLRASMHSWGIFDKPLCQLRYAEGVDEVVVLHSLDAAKRHQELTDGLNKISQSLDFPLQELPADSNHSNRSVSTEIWRKETVERIGKLFAQEIEYFGFQPPVC
ncbi:MAG: hypothetical protein CMI12_10665 [Oceanospirillum sp.]|nr:hypothetical protein [Oceanospirillum sp.]